VIGLTKRGRKSEARRDDVLHSRLLRATVTAKSAPKKKRSVGVEPIKTQGNI